ncbi:vanadium-dependent haloperoxidase [Paracoccaceae bacterium Fryx2]|nr:vanadium-dependent haloperoxidase [Paracoccaceae bacterium Fryx2]
MGGVRHILVLWAVTLTLCLAAPAPARADAPEEVLTTWVRLVLELVRHTPTQSPPVAARAFGYIGVTAYESVAGGSGSMASLAGQLNGLTPLPARDPGAAYDEALVLHAAMAAAAQSHFANTGPTGQRAMAAMESRLGQRLAEALPADVVARSTAMGRAVAAHVLAWSQDDGGAVVANMGFPESFALTPGPGHWVPTSMIRQQQVPLLPGWGNNRPFAMPHGASCPLPAPPDYSEDPGSAFHAEAMEVVTVTRTLTDEQRLIARFWSDDPMLSPTPPGHWISIATEILIRDGADIEQRVDVLARLGIALADAFIGCWHSKFEHDLLRPVTYIRRVIDPAWEPLLITPPFPEYPSGHSTQSGAAASVLTDLFGPGFAFVDATHADDGMAPRTYPDFWAAAEEAGLSRLYGGIHFRAAIERGLDQGRCIGAWVNALKTRR